MLHICEMKFMGKFVRKNVSVYIKLAIFSFFKWVRIQLNAVYLMSYHDILFFSSLLLSEICTIYNKVISIRCLYSVFFFHARYIQGHLIVLKKTRWNGHILRKIIFLKNFLFHFYTWWQNIFLYMYRPKKKLT